jgi:long-chain acyl-CoA synthetase
MSYSYHLPANESWGKGTVEVGPPAAQGESRVRRLEKTKDRLVSGPMDGINTVLDVLLHASRTHGERKAYGYRDILDTIEEQKEVTKTVGGKEVKETKTWKYFHLSDYKYISYLEFKSCVSEVAHGLLKLEVKKGDVFNIYAQTRQVTHSLPPLSFLLSLPLSTPFVLLSLKGPFHATEGRVAPHPSQLSAYSTCPLLTMFYVIRRVFLGWRLC